MTKHKDEWGNISLPGLSDKELFDTNWNYKAAALERNSNAGTRAKYLAEGQRKKNSKEHKELMTQVNRKTAQTQTWQTAHEAANAVRFRDPVWLAWKAEDNRKRMTDPEWYTNFLEGTAKRNQTVEFQQHLENLKQSKYKPIHAGTYGDFPSQQAAIVEMTKQGVINARGKLRSWLKTRPTEYYYIDK